MGGKSVVIRGRLVGQDEASDVVVRDENVVSIEPAGASRADVGSAESWIGPLLFDIQVNGAFGIDLQVPELRVEDVRGLTDRLAEWGVGHWVPTLITGSPEHTKRACGTIAESLKDPVVARAVPGIHLEGPYISIEDGPRGAHPRKHVRPPDWAEFEQCLEAANGKILYVTVAPEMDGAVDFIRKATARGVVVSLGHHAAPAEAIEAAVAGGARLSTHLGNGLASMIHRHVNPLWPQLAEDRLLASLIPDLEHLPAPMLKSLVRGKGADRVILTSDCVHVAGLAPGRYALAGHDVELTPAGRVCLSGTDMLAGSALMLLQGAVNAARVTDVSLAEAFACATTIPAALFGLAGIGAEVRVGQPAGLVVFDVERDGSDWKVVRRGVWVEGEPIFGFRL